MKVEIQKGHEIRNLIFLGMLALFGFLSFRLFMPYLNIIVMALIIVQIFHPFYKFILKKTKNKGVATGISVFVALIVVILVFTIVLIATYSEIRRYLEGNNLNDLLKRTQDFINSIIIGLDDLFKRFNLSVSINQINLSDANYSEAISKALDTFQKDISLPQQVISTGAEVLYNTLFIAGNFLFNLFMLIFTLVYLFPNFENLGKQFNKISPLSSEVNNTIYDSFIKTLRGTIKGTLLVAIIQATVMIIPLLLIGVSAPVLLWIIMVIVSIVPIGSGLVWGPVGLLTIFNGFSSGNPVMGILGILLIVYGAIMVNVIDTAVRSNLIKDTVDLHPILTVFSILGGITFFGFFGIFYGPLIVITFMAIIELFKKHNDIDLEGKL